MFELHGVANQKMWFFYTQWALTSQQKMLVDDVICMDPTPPDAYEVLKERLLSLYARGERERYAKFRHASIILPTAKGFFSPLNDTMCGNPKLIGLGCCWSYSNCCRCCCCRCWSIRSCCSLPWSFHVLRDTSCLWSIFLQLLLVRERRGRK